VPSSVGWNGIDESTKLRTPEVPALVYIWYMRASMSKSLRIGTSKESDIRRQDEKERVGWKAWCHRAKQSRKGNKRREGLKAHREIQMNGEISRGVRYRRRMRGTRKGEGDSGDKGTVEEERRWIRFDVGGTGWDSKRDRLACRK
jgi:hypothetical protein